MNEVELRAVQRKKASYNAKLAKFELAGEEKKRISSQAKVKAKMMDKVKVILGDEDKDQSGQLLSIDSQVHYLSHD